MAAELGTAYVQIAPSTKGLGKQLISETAGPMQEAGKSGGLALGKAVVASAVAAVSAAAGLGVLAFKIGESFDQAADTIRVGTGATGVLLEGLKEDFRQVVASVPTDFASAGTAIADLNTRLGLTGKPLQELSAQFLELARITGGDVALTIAAGTRLFGDWGIEASKQTATLDALFRASQATGATFDSLGQKLVQYGAPLRELGFSFEESAAMLGKFEKEGVNTELVLGGLKMGLGRLAREGRNPREEIDKLQKAISDAGLTAENKAKVFEIFGARAGIDMAKAMEEGRFELGDLVKQISGGSDTILKAGQDTMDFAESWQMLKNNMMLLVEGPASAVFQWVGGLAASMNTMIQAFRAGEVPISGLTSRLSGVGESFRKLLAVVVPWAKAFYADTIKPVVANVSSEFRKLAAEVLPTVKAIIDFIVENWPAIRKATEPVIKGVVQIVGGLLRVLAGIIRTVMAVIRGDWSAAWEGVKTIVKGAVDVIKGLFSTSTLIQTGKNLIIGLWNGLKAMDEWLRRKIRGWVGNVTDFLKGLFGIESPSKLFRDEIGANLAAGVGEGFGESIPSVMSGIEHDIQARIPDIRVANTAGPAASGITIHVDARGASDPTGIRDAAERGVDAALSRYVGAARLKASMMGA